MTGRLWGQIAVTPKPLLQIVSDPLKKS